MSETTGEKTFAPTPKRKSDAAKKGDVLRSRELATAAAILFGSAWLAFAGPWLLSEMSEIARQGLVFDRRELADFQPGRLLVAVLFVALPPILSVAAPMIVLALVTQLGLGGEGRWVNGNLAFKGSRINPLAGLKRMFGPTGWIEMGKGLVKVALLGAIAYAWGNSWLETITGLGSGNLSQQLGAAWGAVTSLLFALAAALRCAPTWTGRCALPSPAPRTMSAAM
ncbi:EscU/YscU/HrcU family type III secretion system export apparatus switch protein [Leptolyngbya sp. 15MV]|nr:EscU/YscU/HrcU family type III secretion system export apparatus switch protein [Leptolyngbya sp. 15MV]